MREGNFNRVEKGFGVSSQKLVSGEVIVHAKSAKFAKSDVESQKSGTDFFNAEKQSSREAEAERGNVLTQRHKGTEGLGVSSQELGLAAKNTKSAKPWPMVRLGDVCEVVAGQSPEGKYYTTDSSFVEFHQGCKAFGSKYLQSSNVYTKEITKVAGEGYIVMSVRAPVGTVNITQREICIGRGLCTFVLSNKIFREFLYFYLLASKKYLNDVAGAGTVFPSISRKQLMDIQIPLPPIEVQKEIVERLEKELGEADKVAAEFKRMVELADKEFKAELDETFNSLSANSASPREIKNDGCVGFVTRGAAEDAEKWPMVRLGDVGQMIRGRGIKRAETIADGRPCIRYGEIYTSFNIILDHPRSFVSDEIYDSSIHIKNGDLVFTLTGENKEEIGKTLVYLGEEEIAAGGDLAVWSDHGCNPKYLAYVMYSSPLIHAKAMASNGQIIVHLSVKKMQEIIIPLPPLSVQKEIVAKLDAAKERCEKLKAAAERGLTAAENLRKAILSEAFE